MGKSYASLDKVNSVITGEELINMRKEVDSISMEQSIYRYIADIVASSRTNEYVQLGISPRGGIALVKMAKAIAYMKDRKYVIPEDITFDFKVDFGLLYAKTTIKTTAGDIATDENGSIQISVKPGKSFAVEGIDAGTKVTVTEIQKDGSGFTVKDGAVTMEGIVAEDGSLKFQ